MYVDCVSLPTLKKRKIPKLKPQYDSDDHYKRMREFWDVSTQQLREQEENKQIPARRACVQNQGQLVLENSDRLPSFWLPKLQPIKRCLPAIFVENVAPVIHYGLRKRVIREWELLKIMDPLIWATGARPNRPFQNINFQSIHHNGTIHTFYPRRPRRHERLEPSQYLQEQLYLAREIEGPNPYCHAHPAEPSRALISRCVVVLSTSVIKPLLDASRVAVTFIISTIIYNIRMTLNKSLKMIHQMVNGTQWDMVLALILAAQVAKWLPGMQGSVVLETTNEAEAARYIKYLPAGIAFGTGPVLGNPSL